MRLTLLHVVCVTLVAVVGSIVRPSAPLRAAPPFAAAPTDCMAFASSLRWYHIPVQGVRPAARRDAALAYDGARQRLSLFGGRNSAPLDDTWAFDLVARTWQPLATGAVTRPPARFSMVAALDRDHNRLLVTTGQGSSAQFFNDVWSFDLLSNTWTQVIAQGAAPPIRYGSAGGSANAGAAALYLSHGFTDQGRFDDTWTFDLTTQQWTNVTPTGPLPLRRCLHAGALTASDTLVIFGGCASGFGPCPLNDTWRFNVSTANWTQLATQGATPAARYFPGLAAINTCQQAVLFGGHTTGADLNDAWLLDASAGAWSPLTPQGAAPAARQSHSMAWLAQFGEISGRSAVAVFGGASASDNLNDLWVLLPAVTCYDFVAPVGVGIEDVTLIADHWGQTASHSQWDPGFDANGDGQVEISDVMQVAAAWMSHCTSS